MSAQMVQVSQASVFWPYTPIPAPCRSNGNSRRAGLGTDEFTRLYSFRSGSSAGEVLEALYQKSSRLVDTSNYALALYDERADTLTFHLVVEGGKRKKSFAVKLADQAGLVSRVITSQTPLLLQDLPETGIVVGTDPLCPAQPIRSWLSVPIYNAVSTDGQAQGVIVVWSAQPNAFSDCQLQSLAVLGARTATAIHDARPFATNGALAERERVIEAQEQVRKELARDLHDGPIQLVSGIAMRLDFCHQALEKDPALLPEQISYTQELAEHAIHQMRTMLFELRPLALETQGLGAALQVLLEGRQKALKTTKLTLSIETCQPDGTLSRQEARVEASIFAIVQEAVNNALKHARAGHIKVHLKETPTALYAVVVDDGQGFDVSQVEQGHRQGGHLGLVNIRERADLIGGELEIESVPGQWTRIIVSVPNAKGH